MGRRFRPTASRLAEKRLQGNERTSQVDIDLNLDQIDKEYLDKFFRKIWFWSFTIRKVRPEMHASKFRVVTHRHIPKDKLIRLIEGAFPDGCKVTLMMGYVYRHTFDVRTPAPMRWDEFIWKVTKSLGGVL